MLASKLKQLNLKKPIAIIGAGVTGKSFFDLLQLAEIDAQIFDERDYVSAHFSDTPDRVTLGEFHADTFTDFATVLISPGIDARRDCFSSVEKRLLTDIELFARLTDKPVIGITASNGKSTVATLTHAVCKLAERDFTLCGNIGLSVLQALRDNEATNEGYIIELSSYHLERAPSLQPAIGVWLNVSPDHLDRYGSYDDYVETKANLFKQSKSVIGNFDDERIRAYIKPLLKKNVEYIANHETDEPPQSVDFFTQAIGEDWHYEDGKILDPYGQPLFDMTDFPQIGSHHADNVMAVFAVANHLGIDEIVTAQACKTFKPLASRMVVVAKHNGITFINDSKGTNIGATVAAIKGISAPIILLAGGEGKDQDFNELADAATSRVKNAVLFGQDAAMIESTMQGKVATTQENNLDNAFAHAVRVAETGDVVMLSPACASFDQFESYLKRGERFEQLVKEWIDANHNDIPQTTC